MNRRKGSPKRPQNSPRLGRPPGSPRLSEEKKVLPRRSPNKPFYRDVANLLADYHTPRYVLLPWIDKQKLYLTKDIQENPHAIDFILEVIRDYFIKPNGKISFKNRHSDERYPHHYYLCKESLAVNPEILEVNQLDPTFANRLPFESLLENTSIKIVTTVIEQYITKQNPTDTELDIFNKNPTAFDWLIQNQKYLRQAIYLNPKAGDILYKSYISDPESIDDSIWGPLCNKAHGEKVLKIIYEKDRNSDKLNWYYISANQYLIDIVKTEAKQPQTLIDWTQLCKNEKAESIILENWEKIHPIRNRYKILARNSNLQIAQLALKKYKRDKQKNRKLIYYLLTNPVMLPYFERHQNLLDYECLSINPGIWVPENSKEEVSKFFEDLEV